MMGIKSLRKQTRGFTIVEMVIVVIVIAVLVGIVAISYSSILSNSRSQSLKSDITSAYSKLSQHRADNGTYPTTLAAAGVVDSTTTTYAYTYTAGTDTYCLAATAYSTTLHVVSGNTEPLAGTC